LLRRTHEQKKTLYGILHGIADVILHVVCHDLGQCGIRPAFLRCMAEKLGDRFHCGSAFGIDLAAVDPKIGIETEHLITMMSIE